ncbi:MAG: hypothetical protein A2068_05650 [Ignavibacteria bacterium GWB2_35_6b]|nr:MAG: hypothetical protein A2068_05650 [Ignavibacteria bacterium GWB2_35_6b]
MRKIFSLAKWDFLEKVKRKSFLVYMFAFPALIILFGLLPKLLSETQDEYTKAIGILDTTGKFFPSFANKLDLLVLLNNQPRYITANLNQYDDVEESIISSNNEIKRGALDGYLLITSENNEIKIQYRSKNVADFRDQQFFESTFNEVLTEYNLIQKGIAPESAKGIVGNVKLTSVQINENGVEEVKDFLSIFFNSYILLMLLTMTIIFSGGTFVRSLISEKANGILEVILSSLSIDQLLFAKILGLIYLSIFQFGVWGLIGYFLSENYTLFSFEFSQNFFLQLVYFSLGYVLYISIFVGLGSVVSTEQGAQQATGLVTTILIFPIVISAVVIQNPDSLLSQIFTYFPLTTPSLQLLKLNFYKPSIWEVIVTIFILILSIYFVVKVSSKIFRVGVLHFDKQPALKVLKRIFN